MIPSPAEISGQLNQLFEPMPSSEPTPASPDAPAPAAVPAASQEVLFAARGFHVDATVPAADVVRAAELMDRHGFSLDTITGVDWIAQNQMEVVYDYFHPLGGVRVAVRCRLPRDQPEIPTISTVFSGANWHERETHEFFGIVFTGHPDLTPLLLPEDATFHPLRKDFTGAPD